MDIYFSTLLLNTRPKYLNEELKRIRRREYEKIRNKNYYHKNKDREKKRVKKYNEDNPTLKQNYNKIYYNVNIEKEKERHKSNRLKDPEKTKENDRKSYIKNREKNCEYSRKYLKENPKVSKKTLWKQRGLDMSNFDEVWERYNNTTLCDYCAITLTIDKKNTITTKCMDHCHKTGKFRAVLCQSCNVKKVTDI